MSTAPVWHSSDEQLLAELGALETQLHATWAQMLSVVAETDSRAIAAAKGYATTVELVRAVARVPRSTARSRVDAAPDGGGGGRARDRRRGCRGDPLGARAHPDPNRYPAAGPGGSRAGSPGPHPGCRAAGGARPAHAGLPRPGRPATQRHSPDPAVDAIAGSRRRLRADRVAGSGSRRDRPIR